MANENGTKVDPETGEVVTIEQMQGPDGPALSGTEQLSFDLGSEYSLNTSTLKLSPVTLAVDGQYQEGNRIKVVVEVEVEYISFPPVKDRGFRVGTERRHFGQVLSAVPVE